MLCVSSCVHDGSRAVIPKTTEWQHIGNWINAAFIFTRADFVNVDRDRKSFIVRADETLTAFIELQRAIHELAASLVL